MPLPTRVDHDEYRSQRSASSVQSFASAPRGTEGLKAQLAAAVRQVVAAPPLHPTDVAECLGLGQSQVRAFLKGHLSEFSVERLLECLLSLGLEIAIQLQVQ